MKLLLDECLPKTLKQEFGSYYVRTVPEMGWAGKKNGELLRLAKEKFDIFVTGDQNLQYQQNLRQSKMAVMLLVVKDNCFETIKPLVPKIHHAIKMIRSGQLIRIQA